MQIRRLLLPIFFAIPLAGVIIWFALNRENDSPAPTIAKSTIAPVPASSSPHSVPTASSRPQHTEYYFVGPNDRLNVSKHAKTERVPMPPKRFLPEESRLLIDGKVHQDAVQNIIRSAQFDEFVRKMRDEMVTSAAAKDVDELYDSAIKNSLSEFSELRLSSLACGATVCAGAIDADGESTEWDQWMKTYGKTAPMYVLIDASMDNNGTTQHRIVFSTDPDSNAVTGSL